MIDQGLTRAARVVAAGLVVIFMATLFGAMPWEAYLGLAFLIIVIFILAAAIRPNQAQRPDDGDDSDGYHVY